MALPKDDEPIPEWTNENVAYLNVIQGASRRRNIHAQEVFEFCERTERAGGRRPPTEDKTGISYHSGTGFRECGVPRNPRLFQDLVR
jgi:hypothetical protein